MTINLSYSAAANMLADPEKARLKFLSNAAHHYAHSSASTSAHLIFQRNTHNHQAAKRERSDRFHSCQACATILLPGMTSEACTESSQHLSKNLRKSKAQKNPKLLGAGSGRKYIKTTCLACHRYEKVPLEPLKPTKRLPLVQPVTGSDNSILSSDRRSGKLEKPSNANQSSRQRAKTRKQGGLQTLLQKSKQGSSTQAGTSLGLMDLMKQG